MFPHRELIEALRAIEAKRWSATGSLDECFKQHLIQVGKAGIELTDKGRQLLAEPFRRWDPQDQQL